jgi:hypothetical protein
LIPEQPVEIAFRHLKESSAKRHSGIVDDNIDATVFGDHLRGKSGDRGSVRDVETMPADADDLFYFVAGDVGGGARERCIVDVGEREMATAARQRHGDRASNSAGRSGDHGRPAFQLQQGGGL